MKYLICLILFFSCINTHAENVEFSTPRYVTGGVLSLYPGFGIGHAVQGRWAERGWIFTASEIAILGATGQSCFKTVDTGGGCVMVGVLGFFVARILEVADAWGTYGSYIDKMNKKENGILIDPVNKNLLYSWRF